MKLFRKRCFYCNKKIKKGNEIYGEVKIPEFSVTKIKSFCSKKHLEAYQDNIKGTPSRSSCPYCLD